MNKKTKLLGMLLLTLVCIFAIPTQKAEASSSKIVKAKNHVIVTVTPILNKKAILVSIKNNNKYSISIDGNINMYEKSGAISEQRYILETVPARSTITDVRRIDSYKKIAIVINSVNKSWLSEAGSPSKIKVTKMIKGKNGLTVKIKNGNKYNYSLTEFLVLYYDSKGKIVGYNQKYVDLKKNKTSTAFFDNPYSLTTYKDVKYKRAKVFISNFMQ